jgi:hypothetical protein
MPKHNKKGKKAEDEDFDDMLAEFQAADLKTASNAAELSATTNSSSTVGTESSYSIAPLPSPPQGNAARRNVSQEAIVSACKAGNLAHLQMWGRQGIRVRTVQPLGEALKNGASFKVLSCLVKELGADVNQRSENGSTALTMAARFGHHNIRYTT